MGPRGPARRPVVMAAGTAVLLFCDATADCDAAIYPVMFYNGQWGREVSFAFAIDIAVRGFAISKIV